MKKIEIQIEDDAKLAQAIADGKVWHLEAAANRALDQLYAHKLPVHVDGLFGAAPTTLPSDKMKPGKLSDQLAASVNSMVIAGEKN